MNHFLLAQVNWIKSFQIAYLPIVIYVPALAFNQVTGVNIHTITPIVCLICVFYTCAVSFFLFERKFKILNFVLFSWFQKGGLKAVVCTGYPFQFWNFQQNIEFPFNCNRISISNQIQVWTDVIQTVAMFGSLLIVAIKGTMNLGSSEIVFREAWNTGRIEAPM